MQVKLFIAIILLTSLSLTSVLLLSFGQEAIAKNTIENGNNSSRNELNEEVLFMKKDEFLGLVKNGQFMLLAPESDADDVIRLTEIPRQAAMTPESKELILGQYEGVAIMVKGHKSGRWIYSAQIIDQAGPILSALIQKVFNDDS